MAESCDYSPGVPSFPGRANATAFSPGQKIQFLLTNRLTSPLTSHEAGQNYFLRQNKRGKVQEPGNQLLGYIKKGEA